MRYKNKRVCGTVPKTGALRKPDLLGEEVVVPTSGFRRSLTTSASHPPRQDG